MVEAAEYSTAKNSLLFNLVMNRSLHGRMEPSPADTIYFAQTKIIKSLAKKESCVIVGRCSDYILRDNTDCIHVFIYSDRENRAKRILERYGESDKPKSTTPVQALKYCARLLRRRSQYLPFPLAHASEKAGYDSFIVSTSTYIKYTCTSHNPVIF
nr:cytidylate kinase-like family protein [uncultured Schaedlerella sp.]